MNNQPAPAAESADQSKAKGEAPVIFGAKPKEGSKQNGLALWPVKEKKEKGPDFIGTLTQNDQSSRVVASLRTNGEKNTKFLSISKVVDGAESEPATFVNDFATANPISAEKGAPLEDGRTPYFLATVKGSEHPVRGYVSKSVSDEMIMSWGFTQAAAESRHKPYVEKAAKEEAGAAPKP